MNLFINTMKQFGDHVLVFGLDMFVAGIKRALANHKCVCRYNDIVYYDKTDYAGMSGCLKMMPDTEYKMCFIKNPEPYQTQNEWRLIIHDVFNEFQRLQDGSLNIDIKFLTEAPIFKVSELHTLQVSSDALV